MFRRTCCEGLRRSSRLDYKGIKGLPSGGTVSWQFVVPSILTTPTTITSFLSASLGPGLSS